MYYIKILLFIVSLYSANFASANNPLLDNANLWLPTHYQSYLDDLKNAAAAVKETEKCHRLLSGKLIEGRSSPEHLIFSFRCRTEERYSFSVEFDNYTKLIKDPYDPFALKKEENRLRKERERVQRYKEICQQEMKKRIGEFKKPKVLKNGKADTPVIKDGMTIYSLSFDSMSTKNKTLLYKVECRVIGDNDYQIKVSPRAEAMTSKK